MAFRFGYCDSVRYVPNCSQCVHLVGTDGCRHFGIQKTKHFNDPEYGKLVAYCPVQEGFVKPYGSCEKISTRLIGGIDGSG